MNANQRPPGGVVAAPVGPAVTADLRELRHVFGAFATGVTVVTVGGLVPHGMTANAFTSVSLDPPLVLVCVDREAYMHDTVLAESAFAVSVLGVHQEAVARHFADRGRKKGWPEFEQVPWSPGSRTGAPLIRGALAWFECSLRQTYDGGDHSIFLGCLVSARRRETPGPLVFFGGQFRELGTKEGL